MFPLGEDLASLGNFISAINVSVVHFVAMRMVLLYISMICFAMTATKTLE